MKLFTCEHPQTIVNRYTHELMTVPCGKCPTCLQRRANSWIDRLENERRSHPYCVFFTLTYNDKYVPKYYIHGKSLLDYSTGELVYIPSNIFKDSEEYLSKRDSVCHPSVTHIQNFIKRIRSKINYYEKEKLRKSLRYFIVSEYGPTQEKHRVHYHGLFFFDSYWFARNVKEVITSCWSTDNRSSVNESYGFISWRFVTDTSAADYTSAYMYFTTDLPSVYTIKELRPIKLCSRHPSIGSLFIKDEDLQKYLFNGVTRVGEYSPRTSSFLYKPLSQPIKNKLFPKIKGFSQISHYDRVRLYSFILERQSEIFDLSTFISYIKKLRPILVPDIDPKYVVDSFLYKYFLEMIPPVGYDELLLDVDYSIYKTISPIQRACRFLTACNRVYHNMVLFGVRTIEEYVTLMEQYFDNCDKQNLIEQFDFEEHYEGNKSDLRYLDIRRSELDGFDYTSCKDYKDMVDKSHSKKTKNQKKKEKYAYMRTKNYCLT